MKNHTLILASSSPRRKALLAAAGLEFLVIPSGIEETGPSAGDEPEAYARNLAEAKARDVSIIHPDDWVLAADTIVVNNGHILGKPASPEEACRMLAGLSGRIHRVVTGYCIARESEGVFFSGAVRSEVRFKKLPRQTINWYVSTGDPLDKAGAYGIQGLGALLVDGVEGSITNVAGLPVREVIEAMKNLGAL